METTANLTIRRVPLASLAPDPANPRSHDERGLDAIRASLARFGQVDPLVVQKSTRRVIGGHGRLAAMKALGWTECDVVELEIDDLQATALGIALNRTSDMSAFHLPTLGRLLESLQEADALDGVGFTEKEVGALLDEIIAAEENLDGIVEDGAPGLPDPRALQHEFSAFLSAARTVLQYACKEATGTPSGRTWYGGAMSSSRVFRYFKDRRDDNIHSEPARVRSRMEAVQAELLELEGDDGEPILIPHRHTTTRHTHRLHDWDEPEDLFSLAEQYLAELEMLINEGVRLKHITG